MRIRGDSVVISAFLLCLLVSARNSRAECYYVCSYETAEWNTPILLVKVNLDTRAIENQLQIPIDGELAFRVPIQISRNRNRYFIVATNDGDPGKNSRSLQFPVLRYCVIDTSMRIVFTGQLNRFQFVGLLQYPLEPQPTVRIYNRLDDSSSTFKGRPGLGSRHNLLLNDLIREDESDSASPVIGGFQYFQQIDATNNRYYWNANDVGVYLLAIDAGNGVLADSLLLTTSRAQGNLFALSANDSLIYAFFTNYNSLGGSENSRKTSIDPSYVLIFQGESFTRLDSVPLPYPSLDYGYVQPEIGSCDRVGPFLVYYFFLQETYKYFSPAMLFIFDTRTNEATWLRVGWR